MSKINLPWPDSALSPNARNRWGKINARKKQRADAKLIAGKPPEGRHMIITFCPPDKRNRDLDNCLAMMKGAIDGLCDAWGVNDKEFRPITIDWGNVTKGGIVRIELIKR